MQITERPPTLLDLPGGKSVRIATQQWALEQWEGEADAPDLRSLWGTKPKFAVNGNRSCAELAVLDHLRGDGWDGVWVNAFAGEYLRREWFPVPAFKTPAQAGAPIWAAEIFDCLRAANGGKLSGFFDVFAWREPGEVRFDDAKVDPGRIGKNQPRFIETALRFRPLAEFTIIGIPYDRDR